MEKTQESTERKSLMAIIKSLSLTLPKLNKQLTQGALVLRKSLMSSSPAFPFIAFSDSQSVKVCRSVDDISRIRLSDFQYQTSSQYVYDSRGIKWSFEYLAPSFTINFWNELRNPEYTSDLKWKIIGRYNIDQLKEKFFTLLEKNDDVLTEHESDTYLRSLFESASSYDDVLNILKKYVFDVNEPELWQEQESRSA